MVEGVDGGMRGRTLALWATLSWTTGLISSSRSSFMVGDGGRDALGLFIGGREQESWAIEERGSYGGALMLGDRVYRGVWYCGLRLNIALVEALWVQDVYHRSPNRVINLASHVCCLRFTS